MRRFNTPPGWPSPPNVRWRPHRGWRPDDAWPEPPEGWPFWVDENGRRAVGPLGRYGGPRRALVLLGTAAVVVLGLVIAWVMPSGDNHDPVAGAGADVPSSTVPTPTAGHATVPPVEPSRSVSPERTTSRTPVLRSPTSEPTPAVSSRTPVTTPEPTEPTSPSTPPKPRPTPAPAAVYKNCAEVRAAGAMPLRRGDPGYTLALDRDGDGLACNRGGH